MCPPEGKSENYVNKGVYELRKTEREKPDSELFRFFSLKYNSQRTICFLAAVSEKKNITSSHYTDANSKVMN